MKQKKAQGHVEVIISFAMFAGAMIFIFMFINPISRNEESFSISNKVQQALIENISSSIGKVYAVSNESGGCYSVKDYILSYGDNFREIQDSENPRVYVIYFSPLFEKNAPHNSDDCKTHNLTTFSVERVVFYEYIENLKSNYNDQYGSLKTQLGLTNDFSFSVYDLEEVKIEELSVNKSLPMGINIESYELPIRVINKYAEIKSYIIKINAWE
ncbi:MAG: hypothetical protein WC979_08270 [Candidatus Pacearchaeota archaeon]|jgi:hypothetical protein